MDVVKKNFTDNYELNLRRNQSGGTRSMDFFPPLEIIRDEITITIGYFPVPTADFPGYLSESQKFFLQSIWGSELTRLTARVFNEYTADLRETGKKVLASVQEFDGRGKTPKIYESTVTRLIELAHLEDTFNLQSCIVTAEACELIRHAFQSIDANKLRSQSMIRADVRRHLSQAIARLSSA
jgi:hypothetical protein